MKYYLGLSSFLSSLLATSACVSGGGPPPATAFGAPAPAPGAPMASTGSSTIMDASQAATLMGYYTGDWGQLLLRQVGDEVWGSYTHDAGGVRGRLFSDGHFEGVWCEDPSRTGDLDAGLVRFELSQASGVAALDGTWGYGSAIPSRDDWDLTMSSEPVPAELEARFTDPTRFCK